MLAKRRLLDFTTNFNVREILNTSKSLGSNWLKQNIEHCTKICNQFWMTNSILLVNIHVEGKISLRFGGDWRWQRSKWCCFLFPYSCIWGRWEKKFALLNAADFLKEKTKDFALLLFILHGSHKCFPNTLVFSRINLQRVPLALLSLLSCRHAIFPTLLVETVLGKPYHCFPNTVLTNEVVFYGVFFSAYK